MATIFLNDFFDLKLIKTLFGRVVFASVVIVACRFIFRFSSFPIDPFPFECCHLPNRVSKCKCTFPFPLPLLLFVLLLSQFNSLILFAIATFLFVIILCFADCQDSICKCLPRFDMQIIVSVETNNSNNNTKTTINLRINVNGQTYCLSTISRKEKENIQFENEK